MSVVDAVTITLTPDQYRVLIQIVDNAEIRGRDAALIVSIQRALAEAHQECGALTTPRCPE
ncbi:MAG: hypothetical protein NUW01_12770 [Gemmatimonadaceae bacterium]|nr:hypothetical protein [Gemmatimonadaceae bacterium]